jgi:hypothetical protein
VRLRRKHPEPPSGTITRERAGSATGIADQGPLGRAHLGASLTETRTVVVVNRTAGTSGRPLELRRRRRAIGKRDATRTASEAGRGANVDQRHRAESAVRGSAVAAASPCVATPRRPSIGHECQVERRWENQAHNGGIGQEPSGCGRQRSGEEWRRSSIARRRRQNEEDDESPGKGRLQPHSARPASGAHPRQHGRKSGARAPSERSPA